MASNDPKTESKRENDFALSDVEHGNGTVDRSKFPSLLNFMVSFFYFASENN